MKPRVPPLTEKKLKQLPTEDYQLHTLYKTQGARKKDSGRVAEGSPRSSASEHPGGHRINKPDPRGRRTEIPPNTKSYRQLIADRLGLTLTPCVL